MNLKTQILKIAQEAKKASYGLVKASTQDKNKALEKMAVGLLKAKDALIKANKQDLENARKKKLSSAFIDRLTLNEKRIEKIASDIKDVIKLQDPVGAIIKTWQRPNGLLISKKRVPIGVIGIIYESRPNVTSDAATLCLKAGNAVILRGGSESFNSNKKIVEIFRAALKGMAIPEEAIQFVSTTNRQAVDELLKLNDYIDLIIPRGGEELIRKVTENSRIPVIKHYKGVCHVYVDRFADIDMAINICFNAKVQRPGVCNAMETMLVDEKIAKKFLPLMIEKFKSAGVEIRGDAKTRKIVVDIKSATEADWYAEYLALILAVKIVSGVDEAIEHINKYGTHLSDSIITENKSNACKFLNEVDSATVYVNASTRFTDGGEFGLGAEIGISTDKIHARGPMGLEELTTYKYVVVGNGQVRK
ncbi:MAG: glutamate-5-semialdehyde dehydrogenase [Candidatus Ratteibacteria bacterium]|nr:glutamate-5-semialdehyde dehydrogenase [Candidatus Ratteibacteria bacterium]